MHEYRRDGLDVWYARILKIARAGQFWLNAGQSVVHVVACALLGVVVGAMAGTFLSQFWPGSFWIAVVFGALLGGAAGIPSAKRIYFSDRPAPDEEDSGDDGALFAPHVPGVQEQFAQARKKEFALSLAIVPCIVFWVYLLHDEPNWPVPRFLPRGQLIWAVLVVVVVLFALYFLNARCPACRRHIGSLVKLRRCPLCGVALRD